MKKKLEPEDFFMIGLIMAGGNNGSTSSNIESEQILKVGYKQSINLKQIAKKIYENKKLIMDAKLTEEQQFDIRFSILKSFRTQ